MKNKKTTYILLPLVLFIWGFLIQQVFFNANENPMEKSRDIPLIKPIPYKQKDSFSITISNRDPFLGSITSKEKLITSKTSSKNAHKTIKETEEIIWPEIAYKGIVSDSKEKVKVYMLIIDGKTRLMHKGETQDDVNLKEGSRETIYAIYKNDFKVIFIK